MWRRPACSSRPRVIGLTGRRTAGRRCGRRGTKGRDGVNGRRPSTPYPAAVGDTATTVVRGVAGMSTALPEPNADEAQDAAVEPVARTRSQQRSRLERGNRGRGGGGNGRPWHAAIRSGAGDGGRAADGGGRVRLGFQPARLRAGRAGSLALGAVAESSLRLEQLTRPVRAQGIDRDLARQVAEQLAERDALRPTRGSSSASIPRS